MGVYEVRNDDIMFAVGIRKCWRLLIKWVGEWVGSKRSNKYWHNTWMVPNMVSVCNAVHCDGWDVKLIKILNMKKIYIYVYSSLPLWSTSSVNEVEKFDCWTPSIRIRVSRTNGHRWKRQFFYWISQCFKYCNNGVVIPC